VDHQRPSADPRRQLNQFRLIDRGGEDRQRKRLGVRIEAPRDAVLDLFGRVRLAEDLAEKELQEVLVVLEPVVAVELASLGSVNVSGAWARAEDGGSGTAGPRNTRPSTRSE
jgi:hypothetical protein